MVKDILKSQKRYSRRPIECPEHPGEYLESIFVGIFSPRYKDGMTYPFYNYCPTLNKIFDGKNMVTLEKYALEIISKMENKNYKQEDIKVTLDMNKLAKKNGFYLENK
jgi:hypothetical protein